MKPRYVVDPARKDELKVRLHDRLPAQLEVRFAYLHGSFLERETPGDVDVAVSVVPGGPAGASPIAYELTLEGLLEQGLGVPVDVRVLEDAPVSFQRKARRCSCASRRRGPRSVNERGAHTSTSRPCARRSCATWLHSSLESTRSHF